MSWTPGTPVRLSSKRFILRSMTIADVNRVFMGWLNDTELCAGQNTYVKITSRKQAQKMLTQADNRNLFYLLIGASIAEKPIGYYSVRVDPDNQVAETTVVLGDKNYWGKKVVLETRAVLLDFLFDTVGVQKVMGNPHGRNLASIYNYKAQGFTCEAVLREQLKSVVDGTRLDQFVFGLLRREWRTRPRQNPHV